MAHVLLDRAKVVATSMSGSQSNYALTNSPPTGFVDFTGVGDGNTTYYTAVDDAGNWEVGIGTFASSGEVLTRTDANVIKSSNSNNRVGWPSSSTPTVFITQPSDKAVYFDASSASSTSILNTGLVVGRDADNDIDFATDNEIIFRAGAADQIKLTDGALSPVTTDDIDLGTNSVQYKNLYAQTAIIDKSKPNFTTVSSANSGSNAVRYIKIATLDTSTPAYPNSMFTIDVILDGRSALYGSHSFRLNLRASGSSGYRSFQVENNLAIYNRTYWDTTNFIWYYNSESDQEVWIKIPDNTYTAYLDCWAKLVRAAKADDTYTAGQDDVTILAGQSWTTSAPSGTNQVTTQWASSNFNTVYAETLDISGDVDIDGTLEADAITIGGTAIGSIYGAIAGSGSIVTTGALDSGSIQVVLVQ